VHFVIYSFSFFKFGMEVLLAGLWKEDFQILCPAWKNPSQDMWL
jgi:hypothetical protein